MKGHIRIGIDKLVYFEYYELEKPSPSYESGCHLGYRELKLRKYEASKQLIEVNNYYNIEEEAIRIIDAKCDLINNQPCTAKITDKATIIELIK